MPFSSYINHPGSSKDSLIREESTDVVNKNAKSTMLGYGQNKSNWMALSLDYSENVYVCVCAHVHALQYILSRNYLKYILRNNYPHLFMKCM